MAAAKRKPKAPTDAKAGVPTQPNARTFWTWTPQWIRTAEISADRGYLRYAANIADWILGDDCAGPLLMGRAQYLLGLTPDFEASGDKRRSARAVRHLEAEEDWGDSYEEPELSLLLAWGILLGVAPAQNVWTTPDKSHGGRILPKLEFWHPNGLRYDQPTREWKIFTVPPGGLATAGIEQPLTPGDGQWVLHQPYGRHRPWTYGLWRGIARLVLLKNYAIGDWAIKSRKGAVLAATHGVQVQSTREQRQQLADDLYNRAMEGVIALPAGFDLKLLTTPTATRETQEAQIELVNESIAVAIRGGNLTTNVQGGSRAATAEQGKRGDDAKRAFDAQSLTTTLHDQSLVFWAQYNYGDPDLAPWPVYPTEPPEDLNAKVETERVAFEVVDNAERLGFEVDRQAFLDEHKIGWAKPGEKPANPPPAPVPLEPPIPLKDGEPAPVAGPAPKQPAPSPPAG